MAPKKALPSYEQGLLLVTMLFARKELNDILSFFPDYQQARANEVTAKFLKLPQSVRITQIILELKRLFFAQKSERAIHPTWITHSLHSEPSYLKALIIDALAPHNNTTGPLTNVIRDRFLKQFGTTQKRAIFDPVLMRLQSSVGDQEVLLQRIGFFSLKGLAPYLHIPRTLAFLTRHQISYNFYDIHSVKNAVFEHQSLRNILLKKLIEKPKNLATEFGIIMVAAYVSFLSSDWQQSIVFSLNRSLGVKTKTAIDMIRKLDLPLSANQELFDLVFMAMDAKVPSPH